MLDIQLLPSKIGENQGQIATRTYKIFKKLRIY